MTVTHSNGTWSFPLDPTHTPYTSACLRRELPNNPDYTVVIVNVKAFMECYERDIKGYVIPEVSKWSERDADGMKEFLNPATGVPYMPRASLRITSKRWFFGLIKGRPLPTVSFTNGRHRARYLQAAGARCIPIECTHESAALFNQYCAC